MNIEEERKAFEEAIPLKEGLVWYPSHGSYMARLPALNSHANQANGEFAAWLKAKLHAKEMAKPTFVPEPGNGGWPVQDLENKHYLTLPSKQRAIEFALNQGYRVIEE